jgi:hypothetical protein
MWQVRANAERGCSDDRLPVWLVPVTGVDGMTHEVRADDLPSAAECGHVAAFCGARVVPAALIVEPGRPCVGCAAWPPAESAGGAPSRWKVRRPSWPRRLNLHRRYAATRGLLSQAVAL